MELVKSRKPIKNIPGQHVSVNLSAVGPAYYLIEVNAAILAGNRFTGVCPSQNLSLGTTLCLWSVNISGTKKAQACFESVQLKVE